MGNHGIYLNKLIDLLAVFNWARQFVRIDGQMAKAIWRWKQVIFLYNLLFFQFIAEKQGENPFFCDLLSSSYSAYFSEQHKYRRSVGINDNYPSQWNSN